MIESYTLLSTTFQTFAFFIFLTPLLCLGAPKEPARCEDITNEFAMSKCAQFWTYNRTAMPNLAGDKTQEQAASWIHQYSPFVGMKCSPYLMEFLCRFHFPECINEFEIEDANDTVSVGEPALVLDAKVCWEIRAGCERLFFDFGFVWPYNCSSFPNKEYLGNTELIDIMEGLNEAKDECRPIQVPMCSSMSYSLTTSFNLIDEHSDKIQTDREESPIAVSETTAEASAEKQIFSFSEISSKKPSVVQSHVTGPYSQDEVSRRLETFKPLIAFGCSRNLKALLCSVYVPACKAATGEAIKPCRSLCEDVRSGCADIMDLLGFGWPPFLECETFPDRDTDCIGI